MNTKTYARKRLEIVVEHPHLEQFVQVLEDSKVRGYTVLSSLSGKGSRGAWVPAPLTEAADRVMIVAVVDQDTLDPILDELAALFSELPGVAFVSDVEVIRPDRF